MVPEEWSIEKLKEILVGSIKNGHSPVASEKETGYWVLGLGALGDDGLNPTGIKSVEPTEKVLGALLSPGDFLVSRSNTPDKVGRSVMFKGEVSSCSYPDLMMRFRIDPSAADPAFIEHKLKSYGVRKYLQNSAAGSSGSMVKINKGILENTPIHLPPLPEQKKIAQILSTWDQAISATEHLLENSQQRKKGLMQQLLTGKKRLPGFEGEWKEKTISMTGKIVSGGTPDTHNEKLWGGDIKWLTPTDITALPTHFIYETPRKITLKGVKESSATLLPPGSLCVCTRASVGLMAVSTTQITTNQGFKSVAPSKDYDVEFLYYLFSFNRHIFIRYSSGSTFLELSKKDFAKITFNYPPLAEQQAIARLLAMSSREIENLQNRIRCLKEEKKALMQQLLTGKRRAKVDAEFA